MINQLVLALLALYSLGCYLSYRRGYTQGFDDASLMRLYQVKKLEHIQANKKKND
jgi:hypothetical protein